jgi:hypothetical protein
MREEDTGLVCNMRIDKLQAFLDGKGTKNVLHHLCYHIIEPERKSWKPIKYSGTMQPDIRLVNISIARNRRRLKRPF